MVHILDHEANSIVSLLDYKPLSLIPTTESLSPPTTEEDDEDDDALNIPKKRKLSPTQNDDSFSLPSSPTNDNQKQKKEKQKKEKQHDLIQPENKKIDDNLPVIDSQGEEKVKEKAQIEKPSFGPCTECKTTQTPQWRKGPQGYKTLCNACGLRWCKINRESNTDDTTLNKIKAAKKATNKKTNKKTSGLLFYRKEFITHGLYSIENRVKENEPVPSMPFELPMPIHYGEQQLEQEFELPAFIWQERELNLIKCLKDKKPAFTKIRANIFVERKPKLCPDQKGVCLCKPPVGEDELGCGDDCINRLLFYECDSKYCPCGSKCTNQRIQKKTSKYKLEVFKTTQRGWGLRTHQDIKKGDFIIEYRGEIISQKLCEERMCTDYVNETNFYFLEYSKGEVIDACTKGTEARFINHNCVPNCHIEKWSYRGEAHFGVFASKDIPALSELSYDYNFSTFNVENEQLCYCGSDGCRGTIGKKIKSHAHQ